MPLASGTRVGSYEILAPIGAGGMGEVYRARDTKLHRDVALKVMPQLVADDPDRLARFHREAMVLASLNHPNIAHVHGFEDAGGVHAIVMEMVEGPTLADRLARGPVPLSEALPIARQIAEALEAAHEKGIVHRDLKPANLKLRDDGTVKVLDFGLAKILSPDGTGDAASVENSPTFTGATQHGIILGTAAYMAPEQAKGRAVDRRADIWAFGVVLFEMLSGEQVFKGDSTSDVLAAVLRQQINWAALPADVPSTVRRLLRRCLERDPKRRLRDIGDAFLDVDAPAEDEPAPAVETSHIGRWLPWLAAAGVAAATVTWALVHVPPAQPALVSRAEFTTKEAAAAVNASHDGTRFAYASLGAGMSPHLVVRFMDQFEGKPIPGADGGFPLFSTDGRWLAYQTLGTPFMIKKIPVTGGAPITLCVGSFFFGGAWGNDDTIVFRGANGLVRVSADGGSPEPLTRVDATKGETAHVRPQFLPGGRQLLFTVKTANSDDFAILDLKTGAYRTVAKGGNNGRFVASGHLTYERGGTLFALPFDLGHLAVTGPEAPVIESVSTSTPDGAGDYSVSDTGLLVYSLADSASRGTTLAWVDRKGVSQTLPGQSRQLWGTGRLSPDGRRIANGIQTDRGSDIWVLDAERGVPTRLTFDGGSERPIWSPDGRLVVYASKIDGKSSLYSVPADGSGAPQRLLETASLTAPNSFTPDGKVLLYDQHPSPVKAAQIFVIALPASSGAAEPHPLHQAPAGSEVNGEISPDGKWVSYESNESGRFEVYVQPFPGPGAKVRVSEQGGSDSRWAHDGRELYFWVNTPMSQLMAVEMRNGTPGTPKVLFQVLQGSTWDVTPSRDRFLVEQLVANGGSTIATVTNWFDELRRRAPAK